MTLSDTFTLARLATRTFTRSTSPTAALEFERALCDLGFYNIEFSPPAATLDGVRYPLTHHFTELA